MGQGKTLAWCDFLSVTVGLTNFIILLTLVVYFLSVKFSGKGAGEVIATSRIGKRVSTFWESKRHGGARKTKKGETKTDKEVAAADIELTSVVAEEATDEDDEQERLTAIFGDSSGDSSGGEVEEEEWERLVDPETGNVYLFNQATGESKWVQDDNEDEPVVQTRINPLVESEEKKDASDWEYIENDPPYWYNAKTEESKWA